MDARLGRTRWSAFGAAVAVSLGAGAGWIAHAADQPGSPSVFVPITPCRLLDTRPAPDNVGIRSTPLAGGETLTTQVTGTNGNCTIPPGVGGVAMNVTIVNPTGAGYLTLFPADASRPLASNLNWVPGQAPTPNAVGVRVSADGKLSIFNSNGSVDVAVDVNGYYSTSDDLYYTKAQVDGALAGKANTGHDHDERYLEQTQPIVIGESAGNWRVASTAVTTSFEILGAAAALGGSGTAGQTVAYSLPLTQPALVGGTAYKLSSVEYCLRSSSVTIKVDSASIFSDSESGFPIVNETADNTDRTAIGCYTVSTTNGTARAYALVLAVGQVSGTTGGIFVTGVRSTWIPA